MKSLLIPKYTVGPRVFLTILMFGMGLFLISMGIFASQASVLACEGQTCSRSAVYPFGISFHELIPPITHAATRAKSGRRGVSLNLTLFHEDGSATEYPGVGTNGDRAAEVAESINSYLDSPDGQKTFDLRSGSVPVGVGLFIFGLIALLLVPNAFSQVKFTSRGDTLEIRLGRWPRRARVVTVAFSDVQEAQIRTRVAVNDFYELEVGLLDQPPIDLGLANRNQQVVLVHAKEIDEQIIRWRGATENQQW